jgi:hypothetical protein
MTDNEIAVSPGEPMEKTMTDYATAVSTGEPMEW